MPGETSSLWQRQAGNWSGLQDELVERDRFLSICGEAEQSVDSTAAVQRLVQCQVI
ncbi:hypothetical protein M419DRAFT_134296 [Trichoderma reesei RUT C-30]|uniref:Uncharacterized protein n=1 Tax=Hypocrea jecorina (strain ATCC 56765 / BCRC 32924 / NRRL 11460 / Rut C-30) TaxID=1344414 RepID=A0A024RWN3_HYPJR|nr:hypothetical protein M419DRAFT_134296 [Trichoderma reesei RUT C-30]